MAKKKDLFDDSVMTFGEHLEALRIHLINALLGLAVAMIFTLTFGESIIKMIRHPIDTALERYSVYDDLNMSSIDDVKGFDFFDTTWTWLKGQFVPAPPPQKPKPANAISSNASTSELQRTFTVALPAHPLLSQLHELDPDHFPEPAETLKEKFIHLDARSDDVGIWRHAIDKMNDPITLNVQEAFMTYIKVAFISGLILASPWIFYQLWLFVAAGLYPHERKHVYIYLPLSLGLFLGGAAFCFYAVFPQVLDFLLAFNHRMKLTAQIRISEWINFAVLMPLMFGISFQLPLAMVFLQKINVFQVSDYREKRRLAILAIAFLSMMLTPTPDPASMLLMMGPMLLLYELGIGLCIATKEKSEAEAPLPA